MQEKEYNNVYTIPSSSLHKTLHYGSILPVTSMIHSGVEQIKHTNWLRKNTPPTTVTAPQWMCLISALQSLIPKDWEYGPQTANHTRPHSAINDVDCGPFMFYYTVAALEVAASSNLCPETENLNGRIV